jgi:hypothetical protein
MTAFVEDGVSPMTINPEKYIMDWKGTPLHCVRYKNNFFGSQLDEYGFYIDQLDHATETDGQSAIYASRKVID